MTVPYNRDVASASSWASISLLMRWRGSIWKSVLPELTIWIMFYYVTYFIFYSLHCKDSKTYAEYYNNNVTGSSILDDSLILSLSRNYATEYSVPLIMLLSFFTTKAFERWQYIFNNIAYAENLALTVNAFIKGSDRVAQLARQTVMRQAILAQVLVYRDVSISVRKRFPTMESLIEADMMKPDELKLLEASFNPYNVFTTPFCWISTLLTKLRQDGNITGEPTYVNLCTEMKEFRKKLETVYNYDCVPIPLAYPQIVSFAVRVHCLVMTFGNLFIFSRTESIWKLNGGFGLVQGPEFLLLLAWLKVAEILANPLGEDDDDLELNHIIDRNHFISRSIIDCHDQCPILEEIEFSANPKYNEHAQNLGGAAHQLMGSAVGSKVSTGRMIEVQPNKLRNRDCLSSINEMITGIDRTNKELSMSTLSIVKREQSDYYHANIASSVFCVEVPSLYDARPIRSLTDEEMAARFADRIKMGYSSKSHPSRLSVGGLDNFGYDRDQ